MPIPFTQWECEMAVFMQDADGHALNTLFFVGSCFASFEFTQGFAEERAETSGFPHPENMFLEETHKVEINGLWTLDDSVAPMPTPVNVIRAQRFVTVFLFVDELAGKWVKRTYYNCQFNPLTFGSGSEVFEQKVTMQAGRMFEESRVTAIEQPRLVPGREAIVRYVSLREKVDLFAYNSLMGRYDALAETSGRATISDEVAGGFVFRINFDGVAALAVNADYSVCIAGAVSTVKGSKLLAWPRLEFFYGFHRLASLSADGRLAIRSFQCEPTALHDYTPDDFDQGADYPLELVGLGSVRIASFGLGGMSAPALITDAAL